MEHLDKFKTAQEFIDYHNEVSLNFKVRPSTPRSVNKDLLLDMVQENYSPSHVNMLRFLSETVCCYSYWVGTMDNLESNLRLSERSVQRTLKALEEAGSLRVVHRPHNGEGYFVIQVAPWYCWRGFELFRESHTEVFLKMVANK